MGEAKMCSRCKTSGQAETWEIIWGKKRDQGAELNNNNKKQNKKKKPTKPTNSKTSELTSSLPPETSWLAAFPMRLLLIKGFTNNCTCSNFCLTTTMLVAWCQIKVVFSIPYFLLLTLKTFLWLLPIMFFYCIIYLQRLQIVHFIQNAFWWIWMWPKSTLFLFINGIKKKHKICHCSSVAGWTCKYIRYEHKANWETHRADTFLPT